MGVRSLPWFIAGKHRQWKDRISFKSATAIRQAKLSGALSIDTSQIAIPAAWAQYPTYRLGDGETLNIATEYRGDHAPAANELNVQRDLWLDFDGQGITALDRITGVMNQTWRLNAAVGTSIGRATVDDEAVLITLDNNQQGIEIRSPSIALEAVTRSAARSGFSASGWAARADHYRSTLHLPPGWRVLHAQGVDRIGGTWLSGWDLWDVFLVLIIISASRKLLGNSAALLAGSAFLIALHEPSTLLLIIPWLLVLIALLPLVSGKIKSLLRGGGAVLGLVLLLSVISFAVSTFRLAIYPSLERYEIGSYQQHYYDVSLSQSTPALEQVGMQLQDSDRELHRFAKTTSSQLEEVIVTASKRESLYQVTENDRVQTGPGLPTWVWNSVSFESSGPVAADQTLTLFYSTPLMTASWRVLAVLLVALFAGVVILRLARVSQFKGPGSAATAETTATTTSGGPVATTGTTVISTALLAMGLLGLLGAGLSQQTLAEDYPPKYLLDTLQQRLIKVPDCLPACASLNDGSITVIGRDIRIEFTAYVDADMSLALPRGHGSWSVLQVSEQGRGKQQQQLLPLRSQSGSLFVRLTKGHHRVSVQGKVLADQLTVTLPDPLHNMQLSAPDWVVEGLVDGRVRNSVLTLRAIDKDASEQVDTLKADPAAAFVKVQRHFIFNKKWIIETTVQRIAPVQGAISLPIQLLANEQPLQDLGEVKAGAILLQLGHRQQRVSWRSTVDISELLQLTASPGLGYVERWTFTPSSLWRLNYEGLPPVKPAGDANAFEPVFKPWPGESLRVLVNKPSGVAGKIHTVESALLEIEAGNQLQRTTLSLDIRSSLGTNYHLTLPEQSEVLRLSIDGRAMTTPAGTELDIPLQPGSQTVVVEFQSLEPIGVISHSPQVTLADGASNIKVQYRLPRDRWPLYLSGPSIGPAMLYWGMLCVIVLAALALPRLSRALGLQLPIAMTGWLLLGLGLSTVNALGVLVIGGMFFLLAARAQRANPATMSRLAFNSLQCGIVLWVVIAVLCMLAAIPMGLLSNPDMQVVGNGSSSHFYNYYQDIVGTKEGFPTVTIISVPILVYRVVMLLWSLWLSTQLIRWAIWGWQCFTAKGAWKSRAPTAPEPESEPKPKPEWTAP